MRNRKDNHPLTRRLTAAGLLAAGVLGIAPALANANPIEPTVTLSGTSTTSWSATAQTVTANASTTDSTNPVYSVTCQVDQGSDVTVLGSQQRVQVTGNGPHVVDCWATAWDGTTGPTTFGTVQIDGQQPTVTLSGPAPSTWLSGPQTITATATEANLYAGIASVTCTNGLGGTVTTTGPVGTITLNGSARYQASCFATSNAGVVGPASSTQVWLDSTAPTVTYSNGPTPGTWYSTPQNVTVNVSTPAGMAPIQSLTCDYNGQAVFASGLTEQAPAALHNWSTTVTLPAGSTGQETGTLTCYAADQAGNTSPTATISQQLDTSKPTAVFLTNLRDPAVILADVADSISGVYGAEIQYQQHGRWVTLPTSVSHGHAHAVIAPNNNIQPGRHALRIVVTDNADNTATYTGLANGRPAFLTYPTADPSQLAYTIRPEGRRVHGVPAANTVGSSTIRLAYRQGARVRGRLIARAFDVLRNQTLNINVQVADGQHVYAHARTNKRGDWTYQLPAGADRTVTITYPGSMAIAASTATIHIQAVTTITLATNPMKYGLWTLVGAQVNGGGIPHGGLAVMVQWRLNANSPWHTFWHLRHTNPSGLMKVGVPVPNVPPGTHVQLRAYVLPARGWVYAGANSQILNTIVH